jgi:MYXO-CTERM domain-containing protein
VTATQSGSNGSFFMPQKGDPSSINGRLLSETDTQSLLQPDQGSQICAGDIGAPVCSSTRSNFGGTDVSGTCGLAGVILGPANAATLADGGIPADAGASVTMVDGVRCSGNAWKVAQLGRHAAFIKQFAPEAFKPITVDNGFFGFGASTAVPDGLWGYKTSGDVKTCQLTTTTLPPTAVNSPVSLAATVSFANMQQNAVGVGRFGIAPANAPTQMTWFAANGTGKRNKSYTATFNGTIAGSTDGDYVVAFRASANGGETWTECDGDGMANGFDPSKALPLKVGAGGPVGGTAPTTTTTLPDGGTATTTPSSTTPSTDVSSSNSSSDPGPSDSTGDDSDAGTTAAPKKKKSGCATSPVGTGSDPTHAPAYAGFGLVLGLAALLRGRRRATRSA